uniref:ABC transporter associated with Fe-S cluster assembly, ATP binding protein n=1 Tax=Magnetococcus massalia (strain MO-1) TaxID=451514 RepID=A0A1S7LDV2_MAGMO|nr:ABC transporter associated with Fe-S cluster assembly, ATP binding protein [Candidatus Magnetococcus massalia]
MYMLEIYNLHAQAGEKSILKGIDLTIKPGEMHVIMGPNGSGKSTLANLLVGHPDYRATQGSVTFEGEDLLTLPPEERARRGLFMAFQYPVEVPGVSNLQMLKAALNAKRAFHGEEPVDAMTFFEMLETPMKRLKLDESMLDRPVNSGFSGGEKKRNEMLAMTILEPRLCILDETDSGLDIDALRDISQGIHAMCTHDRAILVITHYQRLLDYLSPNRVHVMADGQIVHSGDSSLAQMLEEHGYGWLSDANHPFFKTSSAPPHREGGTS